METKPATQVTKDEALQRLGVHSKRVRSKVSSRVDLVHVETGRELITPGVAQLGSLAGITGSALLTDSDSNTFHLNAPFVIGPWACDDEQMAEVRVIALELIGVVVTRWRFRDLVFSLVPRLSRLTRATYDAVTKTTTDIATAVHNDNAPALL